MALERGVLVVKRGAKGKPSSVQVQVGATTFSPATGEVSQSVLDRLTELEGSEVEFERVGGQPKKIREPGGTFLPPRAHGSGADRNRTSPAQGGAGLPRPQRRQDDRERTVPVHKPDFHNPYNFVPAPPRNTEHAEFGDHAPVAQDTFEADRYTGRIRVRMTASTPLLVPDTELVQDGPNGHKTYPLRVNSDGKPRIPVSSIRGMLRSAYEAITNSRFGRFSRDQHGDRLAFRMDARDGLRLIPARVENGQIRLLTGTSNVGPYDQLNGPMYAAWLPRYGQNGQVANWAVRYAGGELPQHGDEVVCWIERFQHHRWDRNQNRHVADFEYWSVRAIVRRGDSLGDAPAASDARSPRDGQSWHEPLNQALRQVHGWTCVTNANINRKHDERVFFLDAATSPPGPFPVTDAHRSMWRELIQNYQAIHAEDLRKRHARNEQPDQYLGPEPGRTAWSRHVHTQSDREISDGTLCYVRLTANRTEVEALFPVMIARELYKGSPWDLLHESLRPAENINELSAADRVFGWVGVDADDSSQTQGEPVAARGEPVAARGLLRVGPPICKSNVEEAVESFQPPGVPLAILSTPKPQQGRFYVARSQNGQAQADRLLKSDAGYSPGKRLRGRKVYPHQRNLPQGHWDRPTEDRTQQGRGDPRHYQEYRRPQNNGQERDDQNRSILGWVKPGAQFAFDLHVHNLSDVELGALIYLLNLSEDCFLRFGGGKPLGFGSVRLAIDACDVCAGNELRARYASWQTGSSEHDLRGQAIDAYKSALVRAYPPPSGSGFEGIPFIRAFLAACRGFADELPVHYPRATAHGQPGPPSPDGESFKWFVANERGDARYALSDLESDCGLPTLPERSGAGGGRPQGDRGNRGGGRRR
jgi:CRISPR-associated protein (TIGR03986 family)